MVSLALPFTQEDLKALLLSEGGSIGVMLVNPLWYGEFPESLIPIAKQHSRFLVGDAQGFTRHVVDGKLVQKGIVPIFVSLVLFSLLVWFGLV